MFPGSSFETFITGRPYKNWPKFLWRLFFESFIVGGPGENVSNSVSRLLLLHLLWAARVIFFEPFNVGHPCKTDSKWFPDRLLVHLLRAARMKIAQNSSRAFFCIIYCWPPV